LGRAPAVGGGRGGTSAAAIASGHWPEFSFGHDTLGISRKQPPICKKFVDRGTPLGHVILLRADDAVEFVRPGCAKIDLMPEGQA
jgi:hypothetical protein